MFVLWWHVVDGIDLQDSKCDEHFSEVSKCCELQNSPFIVLDSVAFTSI